MTPIRSVLSSPSRRIAAVPAAFAVIALAAGCGGSSPSAGSGTGHARAAADTPGESAFQYSACMRKHGVNNFPDPVVKSTANGTSVAIGINPSISGRPAFNTAQKACQGILGTPGSGPDGSPAQRQARTQALIAFARCLRAHGFPNFPDPSASGELSAQTIEQAGINFHTPALLAAGKGCASVTHGLITPAQVVQAVNHANGSTTPPSSPTG
jgi:hypothetical protein